MFCRGESSLRNTHLDGNTSREPQGAKLSIDAQDEHQRQPDPRRWRASIAAALLVTCREGRSLPLRIARPHLFRPAWRWEASRTSAPEAPATANSN